MSGNYTVNYGEYIDVPNEIAQTLVNKLAANITSITAPPRDSTHITIPTVPSGFSIQIYKSNHLCIDLDGNITQPLSNTTGTIVFICTHMASGKIACTIPISVTILAMTQILSVTVSPMPATITLPVNTTQQFTASVSCIGSPNTTVIWSISGQSSSSTKISTTGLLTVGTDEKAPITINVTATSVTNPSISGSSNVNIAYKADIAYTGTVQQVTLQPGTYKFECWGAQGGGPNTVEGGLGAYTVGELTITATTIFAIVIGQKGNVGAGPNQLASVFNNTGTSRCVSGYNTTNGGGATDIRVDVASTLSDWKSVASLRSRIMVAAAGGGGAYNGTSGHGGTLSGLIPAGGNANAGYAAAPTQTTGGAAAVRIGGNNSLSQTVTAGKLGFGGDGSGNGGYGGSGGAGYYGGGGGLDIGGSGGSSFISGHPGCDAMNVSGTHTGQPNHYSGLIFKNTSMTAANRSGNGAVKITRIGA